MRHMIIIISVFIMPGWKIMMCGVIMHHDVLLINTTQILSDALVLGDGAQ